MMNPKRKLLAMLCIALNLGLYGCATAESESSAPSFQPVYGASPPVLGEKAVSGAYFQGDTVSLVPDIKPVPQGTTHQVRLDMTHKVIEVAPGVKTIGWTFGDTVPGPVIHVRQGDKVEFTLANRTDQTTKITFPMPHSLDFHAAMVDPGEKYRTIIPGQTLSYTWTANYPGVFMYHCATPPVLHHMAMGMVGAVVVDPIGGWPNKVDREYVLVQSEFYLKKQKNGMYDFDMDAAMKDEPTQVVWNGSTTRHSDRPLTVLPGERVRLYLLNAGPNHVSSFHVIGTILDRVYVDGNPRNELQGLQTYLLGTSSGAVAEFVIPEAGTYVFVNHQFGHASKGAVGLIKAGGTGNGGH